MRALGGTLFHVFLQTSVLNVFLGREVTLFFVPKTVEGVGGSTY